MYSNLLIEETKAKLCPSLQGETNGVSSTFAAVEISVLSGLLFCGV